MTAKYLITGNFTGSLLMEYKDGVIWKFEFSQDCNINKESRIILAKKIRINEENVEEWQSNPSLIFSRLLNDTTFEAFYKLYPRKDGKKLMAQRIWEKMKESDRVLAITFIDKLIEQKTSDGTAYPYASTYLNQKYWL
jgi:hypothetical protein